MVLCIYLTRASRFEDRIRHRRASRIQASWRAFLARTERDTRFERDLVRVNKIR